MVQLPYTGDMKTIVVVNGAITRQSLLAADLQDRVKLVSRILSNWGDLFTNIIAIPGARCPVIKCEHRATGMKCDLSINNRLALRNTRLIKLFSSLDPRVRPLLYSLRLVKYTHVFTLILDSESVEFYFNINLPLNL